MSSNLHARGELTRTMIYFLCLSPRENKQKTCVPNLYQWISAGESSYLLA